MPEKKSGSDPCGCADALHADGKRTHRSAEGNDGWRGFHQAGDAPGEQRKVYIELLATRMAVNSKRHKKDSLNVQMNAQTLAQGDGAKLVESYALAKQDKLEYYNPVAPAPAKNGPQNEAENKGPQINM